MKPFFDLPVNSNKLLEPLASQPCSGSSPKSKIYISVAAEDCMGFLENLLTRQISFEVLHSAPIKEDIPMKEKALLLSSENTENKLNTGNRVSKDVLQAIAEVHKTYIEGTFEKSPPTEAQIANNCGLKLGTFKNNFKCVYGKPFYQLYMEKKMEVAASLLKQGHRCNAVSYHLGYAHPIKFSKMFQKYYGVTPKKYQIQHIDTITNASTKR